MSLLQGVPFRVALVACVAVGVATRAAVAQPPSPVAFARATAYAARTSGQAVLVMHRGRVMYEAYPNGGSATTPMLLASGSKSFVGVAALFAVADGMLRLDQHVSDLLPEWRADARKSRITFRQLLSLESGIDPGNAGTGCGGPRATWRDAVETSARYEPGAHFEYGPFPFIATGEAIERLYAGETFSAFLEQRLFRPLGISVTWRRTCADAKPQLAGGAATTARDWAVFGEFIRRGGVSDRGRLLPDSLIRELFRPSTTNRAYGMSWWLREAAAQEQPALGSDQADRRILRRLARRRDGAVGRPPEWLPADLVMAAGAGKQRLYVIPSRELVIVRLGPVLGGRDFRDLEFLEPLLRIP